MPSRPTYEELERIINKMEKKCAELKYTENALRESEERYRRLYEEAPLAYHSLDKDGNIITVNPAWLDLMGFPNNQVIGKWFGEFLAPHDVESFKSQFQEFLKNGEIHADLQVVNYTGSFIEVHIDGKTVYDRSGRFKQTHCIMLDITARKQAQEEIRKRDNFLRETAKISKVGGWEYDIINKRNIWTDGTYDIYGVSKNELDPNDLQRVANFFEPADREILFNSFKDSVEKGKPYDLLVKFRDKQGNLRWVRTIAKPLVENGKVVKISGTFSDLTEIKKVEEAQRESEKKYRDLFENSTDFVYTTDIRGNFTDVNKAAEDLTGYTKNELIGMNYKDYTPEDTHKKISAAFEMILNEEKTLKDFPLEVTIKNGTKRYFETCVSPLKEKGEIIGFQGSSRDITERKHSEKERDKLQAQLSNAIEIAHLGPWEYDVINDIFTFNDHFYRIFRTTAEEVGGYTMTTEEYFRRFVHPDEAYLKDESAPINLNAIDPNIRRQTEHRIIYADGTTGFISVIFFTVKDSEGRTIRTYGVNQDITERKRMEEELLRAQKLESVGMFAGGIAHDFNNILTTILGNISMARMQTDPGDETFDLLMEAEKASTRAQSLTKQLLTFAKGGSPIKETASVRDIIMESSRFVLRGSKIGCDYSIAEDIWPVEADVGQINQVINNIVINANQAMPEGGKILISAENLIIDEVENPYLKPGRYIMISIKDQGVGISEKHLSKVFDPYFTTKQEGSGLGLATVYSIVQKHEGHIRVESTLGEGTTFYIYLPASEKEVPKKDDTEDMVKGEGRILVMDDEGPLRKMLGRMLEKLGYDAEFAADGAEAVEKYKATLETGEPYDTVILDLTVPGGMGGKETIKKLLEIDPEVKAVVSSGYSDDPVLSNFQEYGFKGILPKPFESDSLGKVLYELNNKTKK